MNQRTIFITDYDAERLNQLINDPSRLEQRQHQYLDSLRAELAKAQVVPSREIPRDVVTMNSRFILVDLDTKEEEEYTLVFPSDADISESKVSVMAPIGTAIIGYSVGSTITWNVPDGKRRLRVKKVVYQPEAAGDYHL